MTTCPACGNATPCPCGNLPRIPLGNLIAACEAVTNTRHTPAPPDRRPEDAWVADDRRIERAEVDRMFDVRWGR